MWDGWGQSLFFGISGGEIVLHFLWKLTTGDCLLGSDLVFLLFFLSLWCCQPWLTKEQTENGLLEIWAD